MNIRSIPAIQTDFRLNPYNAHTPTKEQEAQ